MAPRAQASGFLIPTGRGVDPLMIRYHRVHVDVRERMAETRVEQAFRNHTGRTLEATYVFPVPGGASVSGFAMWIDGERREGELLEAGEARAIYESIVARAQDPGLVEHLGGQLFRARVFPIAPHSEQRIEIRFTQTLDYQGGVVHYRYPLRTSGRAARTLEDMTVDATIVSGTPIGAVYSPSHPISVDRRGERQVRVGFERGEARLDEDFDLYYAVRDQDVGLSLLTHRPEGDEGYFLAMVSPRTEVTEREIAAKEVIFVFDTSGSMAGEKIERARSALDYMLRRLRPADRFQVVRFSTDVESLFDGGRSVAASPANVRRARAFASEYAASGGTAIDGALTEAFETEGDDDRRPRMVVFLTDGMPTIGETRPEVILGNASEHSGEARLFVFGVGDDVSTTFLDRLARQNRGVGDYFRDGREMERRMSAFFDRIAYPVLTDLHLSFPNARTFDVYPRDLGHLYRGEQMLVAGRYRGVGEGRVLLEGRPSNERAPRTFAFGVDFPRRRAENDWLPRLWATRKVGYLLDQIRLHGEGAEVREEVVLLARRYGIVTPYTSYLVVEDEARPARGPAVGSRGGAVPPARRGSGDGIRSYDFEDDIVGGGLPRPDGQRLRVRRPAPHPAPGRFAPGGSPAAEPAESASAPATPPDSGAEGRAFAQRVRQMREAAQAQGAAEDGRRFVAGRSFRRVGDGWIDGDYRRGMRTLRVRYGSAAYFALLRARADLRRALALGTRVTVVVGRGRAVVVTPDGPEGVSEAEVRRFLGGAR